MTIRLRNRTAGPQQQMPDRYTGLIIHLFAVAHAATAVITRLLNYYDDIPLTLLTIAMLVIIAVQRRLSLIFTAVAGLVISLLGYLAGVWIGEQLDSLLDSSLLASAITTFALTELFGWGLYLLSPRIKIGTADLHDSRAAISRQIIITALVILLVRITYSLIFRSPYYVMHGGIYTQFRNLFSNTFATLTVLGFIAVLASLNDRRNAAGNLLVVAAIVLVPLLPATIAYYDFPQFNPHHGYSSFNRYAFGGLYSVALLTTLIIYPAALVVKFAIVSHRTIRNERSKKLSEQYKYAKLKQQISPHFLFNSLNILDSLVQNGENERAGVYIRKLASLYRYILKNEEEQLVSLGEELDFTDMYIDLLKVRFADGLFISQQIAEADRRRSIVPCGLQMLIENAIKHNIVSAESPLRVTVEVEGGFISVSNNLQPRISTQPSTRLSLKNLSRQYENIAGRHIEIIDDGSVFRVRLPLL